MGKAMPRISSQLHKIISHIVPFTLSDFISAVLNFPNLPNLVPEKFETKSALRKSGKLDFQIWYSMGFKIQEGLKRLSMLDTLEKWSSYVLKQHFWMMMLCIDLFLGFSASKKGRYIIVKKIQALWNFPDSRKIS